MVMGQPGGRQTDTYTGVQSTGVGEQRCPGDLREPPDTCGGALEL